MGLSELSDDSRIFAKAYELVRGIFTSPVRSDDLKLVIPLGVPL